MYFSQPQFEFDQNPITAMGGSQPSKLTDVACVENLSFLEEGDFSKLYKGYLKTANKVPVTIKVPKVPDYIRKEKSKGLFINDVTVKPPLSVTVKFLFCLGLYTSDHYTLCIF